MPTEFCVELPVWLFFASSLQNGRAPALAVYFERDSTIT
jgi:hypothetical protein